MCELYVPAPRMRIVNEDARVVLMCGMLHVHASANVYVHEPSALIRCSV